MARWLEATRQHNPHTVRQYGEKRSAPDATETSDDDGCLLGHGRGSVAEGPKMEPGSTIVIVSLVSESALNGRRGIVQNFVPASGRYGVKVDGEPASIALKPGNLQPAPALGSRVILVSLVSRSDLNGCRGIVHGFKCETTRFEVELDGEETILLLKPQNLREVVRVRPSKIPGLWSVDKFYTNVIFKSRKIYFDTMDIDNHKVLASEDIKAGDILLIEHLASHSKKGKLANYVKHNQDLFDNLYPRPKLYDFEDRAYNSDKASDIDNLANEKLTRNVFEVKARGDAFYFALGIFVSKFNHKTSTNDTLAKIDMLQKQGKQLCFALITAKEDMKKGSEITIDYLQGYFDLPKNTSIPDIAKNIMNQYMNTPEFHQIHDNQALADNCCTYHWDDHSVFVAKPFSPGYST